MEQESTDQNSAQFSAVQAELWAREQAIYNGRRDGTLDIYLAALAPGYMAWPPHTKLPIGGDVLASHSRAMQAQTQEQLEMRLTNFTMNGTTAIIYYQTHRTMRPEGTPVDEWYNVIHVWVADGGDWKMLGGMARLGSGGFG